jgi:WD repeat-containing protein 32
MQLSQTTIPVAADFTHLFSQQRKTNRVEFVTDFPTGDDAEVVSSLQIHPQGWCALSRNISNDENTEVYVMSCVQICILMADIGNHVWVNLSRSKQMLQYCIEISCNCYLTNSY